MRQLVPFLFVASTGCSALTDINAGYLRSVTAERGALGIHASSGAGDRDSGLGMQARAKIGGSIGQLGVGGHLYALSGGRYSWPFQFESAAYVRAGMDLLQVGVAEGHGSAGVLCPFVDVGWLVSNPGIVLSVSSQYDWRLSSAKNDLWIGAFIGFGFAPSF